MLRSLVSIAAGVTIGVVLHDIILGRTPGSSKPRIGRPGRAKAGAGTNPFSADKGLLDQAGRRPPTPVSQTIVSAAAEVHSFKSIADCFDSLLAAHDALWTAINDYGNEHPDDPNTMRLLGWWTKQQVELDHLIRDTVINDPEVIGAVALIRLNSEDLTKVSQEFQHAAASVQRINRALSLVSALVSLFKK